MLRLSLSAVALLLLVLTTGTAQAAQPVTATLVGGKDPRAGRLEVYYNGMGHRM